jgi:NADH-quinone oxidoreductase subunit M
MILAAGYLLYMYGRVVFGEVSAFLEGLGDHLTDMTPVEILTLVPLGTLVVIFGLQPGLLLNLFPSTVTATLAAVQPSAPIAVPTTVVVGLLLLLLVFVVARIAWVLLKPRRATPVTEGGAAH